MAANGFDDLGFSRTPLRSHSRHPFLPSSVPQCQKQKARRTNHRKRMPYQVSVFSKRMMSLKNFPSKVSARYVPKSRSVCLTRLSQPDPLVVYTLKFSDWDDSQTDLANLASAGAAGSAVGGDKLWEDNWDDDDIEEEFSTQLRFARIHPAHT